MGITRGNGVSNTSGSIGLWTYRMVRGRCISSFKRGKKPVTRVDGALNEREAKFKLISTYIGMHRRDINLSFDRTKYGSQGNYFYKVNRVALEAAFAGLLAKAHEVTNAQIEAAVTAYAKENPTAIFRVKRAGYTTVYLDKAWTSAENPTGPTTEEDNDGSFG